MTTKYKISIDYGASDEDMRQYLEKEAARECGTTTQDSE